MLQRKQGIGKYILRSAWFRRIIRLALWLFGSLTTLLITLSLLLLIPSVQKFAVDKATNFLTTKTKMNVDVGSVHISFPKTIKFGQIYLEDLQADTLLYCDNISIDADLLPLIWRKLNIGNLLLEGVKARIYKIGQDGSFNFTPLLAAFATQQSNEKKPVEWQIGFDELNLKSIDLSYASNQDSTSMQLLLDYLKITDNGSDILKQDFSLKSIELGNTSFNLIIDDKVQPISSDKDQKEAFDVPISLNLGKLAVKKIAFSLEYTSSNFFLSAFVGNASITPQAMDLSSQKIELRELLANELDIALRLKPAEKSNDSSDQISDTVDPQIPEFTFGNFDWNIVVNHTEITDTKYRMDLNDQNRSLSGMDYMHMDFSNINVVADSIYFNKEATGANVSSISLKEISGPQLLDLKGVFAMNNQEITGRNLDFKTLRSHANGSVNLSYPALQLIGKEIKQLGINADLEAKIQFSELKPFTTFLDEFPALQKLEFIKVNRFKSKGVLSDLAIESVDMAFGKSTILQGSSKIVGLPSNDLEIAYQIDTLFATIDDYAGFIPDTLLPSGIVLPQTISIRSSGQTNLSDLQTNVDLSTDIGNMHLVAQLENNKFTSELELLDADLGATLNDTIYGKINLKTNIDGEFANNSIKHLDFNINLKSFDFNDYSYQNGLITIDWTEQEIGINAHLNDSSLMASIVGNVQIEDSIKHYNIDLDLQNSDFQKLNFTDKLFTTSGIVIVDLDIKSRDDFRGFISAGNITLSDDDNSYTIDTITFDSDINQNYTNFKFNSEILTATLSGNTRIDELKDALIDHLDLFIHLPDSIVSDKNFIFEFNLELKDADILTKFLVDDLKEIQLENCFMKYDDEGDVLIAHVNIPVLDYKGLLFKDLALNIDSKEDIANTNIMLKSLSNGLGEIYNMELKSIFTLGEANIFFNTRDLNNKLKYQLNSKVSYRDSLYQISLDPENTVIGYEKWLITEENSMQFKDGKFSSTVAEMTNGNQKISMSAEQNHIQFQFDNFQLQNITNLLEYDSSRIVVNGGINGKLELFDLFTQPEIASEINIPDLSLDNRLLGDLHANGSYNSSNLSKFELKLQNEINYLLCAGASTASKENPEFSVVFEADIGQPDSFEPVLSQYINELDGAFKGKITFQSRAQKPMLNGNLNFDNLSFTINKTKTVLTTSGTIFIDDNTIRFESFEIRDNFKNPLAVNGKIEAGDFSNPVYDLSIHSEKFFAMDSKQADNPSIFGKLNLGADILVKGKQSGLNVQSSFSIVDGTDITYVMPGKDLELITDEGIVEFVDFENQEYEVRVKEENMFVGDSIVSLIDGIDLTTNLKVDPKGKFTIIVDPNSGDFTNFQFNGNLQYKYNDNQRGMLTGLVEMQQGFYELSFYGLVKKRFNFDPGSTISWGGDVMDGDMNFSARHTVRTNSVGLVSNEISSYERSIYNQRLPYEVILRIQNKIRQPAISFQLDLPQQNRNSYPTLDSKLNMLNQANMESERNKQVFALLVGGTFIPENPDVAEGSSSDNFATTAARNSVNAIMTQQLNKLTGQIIQGLDVNMGVNTFDDYAGGNAQTRTQLDVKVSKNLFNDRVSAEMESHIDLDGSVKSVAGQNTAGMTEFAVSYKLTEAGNYRIKAFRENAYDIFDGEIQNSGIAFIFVREFDSLKKRNQISEPVDSVKRKDISNSQKVE